MRDGQPVHFLVTLIPERGAQDAVNGFFLTTSDIMAFTHPQNDMRRSEARLRAITDNVPPTICSIDAHGVLQFANRPFEMRAGVSSQTATGHPFRELIGEPAYLQTKGAIDGTR